MSCYYVYKISDKDEDWNWDEENEEWDEEETNLDIRIGFDKGYKGDWLTVEDYDCPARELKDYIFHNMRDIEGDSITISELERVLADCGVGIPYPLA
ncbi:hypothetical protein H6G17_09000 [Chroococcidiopsis sp. FACHB-1243]|uniref:hypothetical protein n=1 Tax=Chroococcidiopsis sp. [FACHB-1243] TaxID=2692781 RepID=UPI001784D1E2|nr:hypothetical protein [Chroococcidiopsis sp. [FACHB-1243]]MBD2305654.1 hypothetical protein [Chroococcidiopsis sp. [FACHB-1243]]